MMAEIYQRQEQGYYKPKPDDLKRYAILFGVSVGWLNTGIGAAAAARWHTGLQACILHRPHVFELSAPRSVYAGEGSPTAIGVANT